MTNLIDGKLVSSEILKKLTEEVKSLKSKPCLAVIIVGEDPASKIYVNLKKKKAIELGIESVVIEMPENTSENELLNKIEELNNDKKVNAILVQLPLPKHINTNAIIEKITPIKDVDCFHPYNIGQIATNNKPFVYPCTPKGILSLLDFYNIKPDGKNVVVVGRSNIVGRPLAQMLLNKNATVTICHSKTENLEEYTKKADILICAAGKTNLITSDMIKDGVIIIDVGMNRNENGKLCGDVDFDNVKEKTSYITPVPGGVGPMTICSLMVNSVELYKRQSL